MLEVEHLVTPLRADSWWASDQPSNESFFATSLRWWVKTEDLEHYGVSGDRSNLVTEVILELIGPAVDVVRLNLNLEGPVVIINFFAVLVELRELHDRHGTSEVSNLG